MAKEGWAVPFVVAKGVPRTSAHYALKRDRGPNEFVEECARHEVAMSLPRTGLISVGDFVYFDSSFEPDSDGWHRLDQLVVDLLGDAGGAWQI